MEVVLYKGKGDWFDTATRWRTRGPYSHVELRFSYHRYFSSSIRDGGTRFKRMVLRDENWDRFALPTVGQALEQDIEEWCRDREGRKYDFWGIFGIMIGKEIENPRRWYCSEICARALKVHGVFDFPAKVSPSKMARMMQSALGLFVPVPTF